MDFATWLSGTCSFECAMCGERFAHSISFYTHLAAGHRTRPSDYAVKHGSALVDRNTVVCAECRETVDHEKGSLQKHFAQKHPGLRLRDYFEKSVRPSQASQATDPSPEKGPGDGTAANIPKQDGDQRPRQQRRSSLSKSGQNKENMSPINKRDQKNFKDYPILRKMLDEGKISKCGVCGEAVTGSIFEHIKTKHRKVKMVRGEKEKANKNTNDERAASATCSEEVESAASRNSEMEVTSDQASTGNASAPTPEPQTVSDSAIGDKMFKCDSCGKILAGFEAATTHIVEHSHGTFSTVLTKGPEAKEGPGKDCGDGAAKVNLSSGNVGETKHDIFIDRLCIGDEVTLEEDCIIEDSPVVPEVQETSVSILIPQEDPLTIEVPRRVVRVAKCPLSSNCPELLPDERNLTAHLVSTHQISDTRTLDILVAKIKTHFVEI